MTNHTAPEANITNFQTKPKRPMNRDVIHRPISPEIQRKSSNIRVETSAGKPGKVRLQDLIQGTRKDRLKSYMIGDETSLGF